MLVALLLIAVVAIAALEHRTRPAPLPSPAEVRSAYRSSEATLLDRNGAPLQTLRIDFQGRRLDWQALAGISPALTAAVVHAEDRRFHDHGGVDLLAVLGAVRDRVSGRARRGASTLEMQLAAKLDPSLDAGAKRRGLSQKLRQMRAAASLGAHWSKEQVLEAYLNLVSFRGETRGIAAAARGLFAKDAAGLTDSESWTLAALLPAPGAPPERVARRACALAGKSGEACDALRRSVIAQLSQPFSPFTDTDLAPQLARRLLRSPGERLQSTLDARVQRIARHALEAQLRQLEREQVRDGAAVVVDNTSGEVLAYVGSAGPASRSAQVDGARALRQAGSTLKPFLYGLALEHGWITAASLLDDAPVALEAGPGLYLPQNYEHDYKGLVSVRTALAGSLNIPAVRTLLIAGLEPFRERLRQFGYAEGLTESAEFYGYSLALGSAEVSLLEQANAYRALANGGRWSPLKLRAQDPSEARTALSPEAAWIVSDILADRGARAITFALEGPLSTPYWAAVKTGTSKHLRDNWCVGYTRRHTIAVWVGNFEGDPMRTVSGVTGAAPAWREIADALQEMPGSERGAPPRPPQLVQARVRFEGASEAPREEWFVAGTQTTRVSAAAAGPGRARLVSPARGSLIALDPDIPLDRQHVTLRAEPQAAQLRLQLDGRDLGHAGKARLWTPLPGEHRLQLVDAQGKLLDEVPFSVRDTR